MAGYSDTPLAKKLGIKSEFTIRLINPPDYYITLFTDMPAQVYFDNELELKKDFIHFFTLNKDELLIRLPLLKGADKAKRHDMGFVA